MYTVHDRFDRTQFRVDLVVEPIAADGQLEKAVSSLFARGTMAVTSTTKSAGMVTSSPSVKVSRVVTSSWPLSSCLTDGSVSSGYFM